ncbi:MAG TPA: EamA family transporter [Clostridiales bacterium UBA8960]|nr:EamA family transporter [Clostridiales bacterium UBA8960]
MSKRVMANILLMITAAIWGFGFVAQRVGAQFVGAFTFNGIRFALGSLSLLPLIYVLDKKNAHEMKEKMTFKGTVLPGMIIGSVLFVASTFQQVGMAYTTAGNGGFITGLYMVFVPIFGIFLKQKIGKNAWAGVFLAVIGLYLLSVNDDFTISYGDFLVLISAVFWAIHILTIDKFAKEINPLKLSSLQFATCSVLSIASAFMFETVTLAGLSGSLVPILYGGLLSVGVAYTLQVVAQKDAKPSHAAIILSTEAVFGAVGGALLLSESMSLRGALGCALILVGIVFSQLNFTPKKAVTETA